ncbi:MAG: hypothetical protein AB7V13_26120, partial [Pseudorhodoplanes sp.]
WFQPSFTPMGVDRGAIPAYLAGMAETLPGAAPRRISWPLVAAGSVIGALVAIACALWIHYGAEVFFEMLRAGIAACF